MGCKDAASACSNHTKTRNHIIALWQAESRSTRCAANHGTSACHTTPSFFTKTQCMRVAEPSCEQTIKYLWEQRGHATHLSAFLLLRPGRPPPKGLLRAKSMCFWLSTRTMKEGTFTICLPTLSTHPSHLSDAHALPKQHANFLTCAQQYRQSWQY